MVGPIRELVQTEDRNGVRDGAEGHDQLANNGNAETREDHLVHADTTLAVNDGVSWGTGGQDKSHAATNGNWETEVEWIHTDILAELEHDGKKHSG